MEKDGKLSSLLERLKDCNISHFKKNFIIAGPKTNVLAIYNALKEAGVPDLCGWHSVRCALDPSSRFKANPDFTACDRRLDHGQQESSCRHPCL